MKFRELHDRLVTGDPATTADKITDDLDLSLRAREYLWPLIANECERIERERVRSVEAESWGKVRRNGRPASVLTDRAKLFTETFPLGDGTRVSWGDASADDHRKRIAMLERLHNGIAATIGRHAEAVELIESAGVRCLNELPVGAP